MSTIKEIQARSNKFINNLNIEIALAVEDVEQEITDINRKQLLSSENANGTPLINNKTGSPKLSLPYAKLTNKKTPTIFRTGDYQRGMFLVVNENTMQYTITSDDEKVVFLPDNYNYLHGISQKNRNKAYLHTTPSISKRYKKALGL